VPLNQPQINYYYFIGPQRSGQELVIWNVWEKFLREDVEEPVEQYVRKLVVNGLYANMQRKFIVTLSTPVSL
jgi:hypothetical protein